VNERARPGRPGVLRSSRWKASKGRRVWPISMKARDPVCGMSVDPNRAPAQGVYRGETVYFCSTACQKTYDERMHSAGA
jgi:YHS domain-containing protein